MKKVPVSAADLQLPGNDHYIDHLPPNGKSLVFYDCTRAVMYLSRPFPSGIERVDISYLEGVLQQYNFHVVGVMEMQSKGESLLIMLSQPLLLKIFKHLHVKWIAESVSELEFGQQAVELLNLVAYEIEHHAKLNVNRIDIRILELVRAYASVCYLNCTFINIPDGPQHHELMEALGIKTIHVIHDLIPIEFPEYTFGNQDQKHLGRLIAVNALGGLIVAISDHVKAKIESALLGVRNKNLQIVVNRSGVTEKFIRSQSFQDQPRKNQFVYVSTIEPRKNHALLLDIWRRMYDHHENHEAIPKLLIIGRRGWGVPTIFDALDKNTGVKINIIEKTIPATKRS